ncbi:MAG TPA: hypothetical protein VN792_06405, partial [Candidatus Acidoferrales bacterium]|nr:hypothetical protein [Candidatus Acidoferrales bacterium]
SATSATSNFSVPISHCMGSAAFDLYTGAIGGQPAVKIGNPPTQSEAEAARNRVSVAEQKSKEALANWAGKRLKELDAWRKAITGVSEPLMSNLQNAASAFGTADFAFEKALDEFGKALNSASAVPAANAKLEAASVALADAKDTLDRAKQDVIDHMTPENRAAWQSAKAAADDAKIDITLTEEELRDAREALDKLPPSAWLKLSF